MSAQRLQFAPYEQAREIANIVVDGRPNLGAVPSRTLPQRVDLSPLRAQLEAAEIGTGTWSASQPSTLTPYLRSTSNSSIANAAVRQGLIGHLRCAPGVWDPFTLH